MFRAGCHGEFSLSSVGRSPLLKSVLSYLVEAEALLFYLVEGQYLGTKKIEVFFFLSF